MQGRGMVRWSSFWTVFSSSTRPPASQDSRRFCASWVWGPAAGPRGDAARWPDLCEEIEANVEGGKPSFQERQLLKRCLRVGRSDPNTLLQGASVMLLSLFKGRPARPPHP